MNILALDLSLTATGFAHTDGRSGVLEPPKGLAGMRRLQWIRFTILQLALRADLVIVEHYAFAKVNQAHYLGELGGVVRIALADRNKPYVDVTPASLKMFATGKGNATKNDVLTAAVRKLGYQGSDHNEADALFLLEMARVHYSGAAKTQLAEKAMAKVHWPVIVPVTPPSIARTGTDA